MPQDFYSELDPNHFADQLLNTYDPANPMKQQYDDPNDLSKAIADQLSRRNAASKNIDAYQEDLKYNPLAEASKQYKDLYKWKGQNKTTKAKTIGTGILDVLGLASGKGIKQNIQDKTEAEFKRRQQTIPQQITTERLTESNANNALTTLQGKQSQREQDNATLAYKTLLMNTQSADKKAQLQLMYDKLTQDGPLTSAKVELLKQQAALAGEKAETEKGERLFGNPTLAAKGLLSMSGDDKSKYLTNFEAMQKAMGLARPGNSRTPNLQLKEGPEQRNIKMVNGQIIETPFKSGKVFNPDGKLNLPIEQRFTDILPPGGGRNYPVNSPEYKRFQDTRYSVDLFNQSVGAMLNDVYTGRLDERSLFADTSIGRKLREMTNTDPLGAMAAREQLNQGSLSAIQHVRTITGGRPAAGFINDLESLLTAKGATAEEKFAAQITQKYTLEMALASMAGSAENDTLFSDPKFYDYMQKKSAALYKVTKDKRYRGGAPSLQQVVADYKRTLNPATQEIAPRQNYKNRIPGMN